MTTLIPKFEQNGSTTVNRPINQKLAEQVSVLDFGADPTGLTDSSTAFASAIATGKAVYVPKGTYQASFDLESGTNIYGDSNVVTIIFPPTGATFVIRIDARTEIKTYCKITDLFLNNTNAVANCVGILFEGTDVNSVNDSHTLSNVIIISYNIFNGSRNRRLRRT